jgi:hypothetical protein
MRPLHLWTLQLSKETLRAGTAGAINVVEVPGVAAATGTVGTDGLEVGCSPPQHDPRQMTP